MANTSSATSTPTTVTDDYMEALKRRVDALEKKIMPQDRTPAVIPLTTAVKDLERKLDALANKEKSGEARQLWEKTRQLENLLSPEYLQSLQMTTDAKLELLCGQVEQLKQLSQRMEEVYRYTCTLIMNMIIDESFLCPFRSTSSRTISTPLSVRVWRGMRETSLTWRPCTWSRRHEWQRSQDSHVTSWRVIGS